MINFLEIFIKYTEYFIRIYLFGYATFLVLSVTIGSMTLYNNRLLHKYKNELKHDFYVPITIIVPAYNEEITVVDTVNSLLNLDYKLYEIVVVDDGSKDNTSQILIDTFDLYQIERPINQQIKCKPEKAVFINSINNITLTLVRKENGGKADALNMGINVSEYPYFICLDADSVLQHDSLKHIASPILEDDDMIACGGMIGISNDIVIEKGYVKQYKMPRNLLVCMQILEYDRSFLSSKILLDQFNGNLIISGAFGLFKKDIAITVGGYDTNTLGEDMELVVKLHVFCRSNRMKYKMKYVPDAICWSQAPESLTDLVKQRRRWYIGLFQTMLKYRTLFINYKFGIISFISFLYYLVYELFSPFIEVLGILTIILAFSIHIINFPYMISFFLIYAIYGSVLSLVAFFSRCHTQNYKLSLIDIVKALLMCLIETSFLRFIMSCSRVFALFHYRKKRNEWGKIKRSKH